MILRRIRSVIRGVSPFRKKQSPLVQDLIRGNNEVLALQGMKTYLVAALLILAVVAEVGLGWDVPGFDIDKENWLPYVLNALGLGTLRAGVAKVMLGR